MTSSKLTRMGKELHERLVNRLMQANTPVTDLAQELGLTLPQLAAWAGDPRNLVLLQRLAQLAEIQAHMVLSRYRANAAMRLIQIATDKEPTDLSRKACVDFLSAEVPAFSREGEGAGDAHATSAGRAAASSPFGQSDTMTPRREATILRAFEQLAASSHPAAPSSRETPSR